jgi:hypothetical protein
MYIYPDKSKYVGRIIKGLKQGHGNQVWSPHDKYDGEFKDDKFSGKGTLIQFGGYKWVGEFENGLPNGKCTYKTPDGIIYVGYMKDGLFHGYGKIIYKDGREWEGDWQNDLPLSPFSSKMAQE